MYNPFSLAGKTVLVMGASSGIGRTTAIECSKLGARVFVSARNEAKLNETLSMLEGEGHKALPTDICNPDSLKELVSQVDCVDGIVVSSGISKLKPLLATKEDDLDSVFSVNSFAPMMLLKFLVKAKKMNVGGSAVFIASISGNTNIATALGAYGASKSALRTLVQYAALELSGKQIRCNTVSPGRIQTELLQNQTMTEEDLQRDIQRYPLRRYGNTEEVALACVYLLSDAAKWTTGTDIVVDGGRSLT